MIKKKIAQHGLIAINPTAEADLDRVLQMERGAQNAPFIRQWPLEQHRSALVDSNIAHLTIRATADNRIIGYIILIGLNNPDLNLEFKRIVIDEKGNGFGREAVQLIKKYAFAERGLHRVWLEVMEMNSRAFELYKSEGFVVEGRHREAVKQGDKFTSLVVMSILAHEYEDGP